MCGIGARVRGGQYECVRTIPGCSSEAETESGLELETEEEKKQIYTQRRPALVLPPFLSAFLPPPQCLPCWVTRKLDGLALSNWDGKAKKRKKKRNRHGKRRRKAKDDREKKNEVAEAGESSPLFSPPTRESSVGSRETVQPERRKSRYACGVLPRPRSGLLISIASF